MMKNSYYENLPHLKRSIPKSAYGYAVSMYTIALEGWRRGLTLKFYNKNRRVRSIIDYSLECDGKKHYFSAARGDLVSKEAIKICIDKHKTKKILEKAGVPVPKGDIFNERDSDEEIIKYSKNIEYPVVIKPLKGRGGKGVIANIKNEVELGEALQYIRKELGYSKVILEEHIFGVDHRVFVIGDKVVGAFKRIPANVIGNGKQTIEELLKQKNKNRNKNPALNKLPIKVDEELQTTLKEKGYTLDSVSKKGERVFLKTKNNVSSGGDATDSTDELSDEVKKFAVKAAKAIPGLIQCGIDIIIDPLTKKGVVLEVNSKPSIRNHLFPMEGKGRDIPKAIIDYYFPETTGRNEDYYFDIDVVFDAFENGTISDLTIPNMPQEKHYLTRFVISGTLRGVNYEKWVKRQARKLNLNGYVKNLKNGKTSVVVAGTKESLDEFRNNINNQASKRAVVTKVVEKTRKSPVKIGFEIIK